MIFFNFLDRLKELNFNFKYPQNLKNYVVIWDNNNERILHRILCYNSIVFINEKLYELTYLTKCSEQSLVLLMIENEKS